MNPITHALVGWVLAEPWLARRRDRGLVVLAGVLPDLDGLGLPVELATRTWDTPLAWYTDWHRVLCHNLLFCVLVAGASAALAHRRARVALWVVLSTHLHLLGDLVGSRGPDGRVWAVPYFQPMSARELAWSGQWALDAWPNLVLTVGLLAWTLYRAWQRGDSPVGLVSPAADRTLVETLRRRFGIP